MDEGLGNLRDADVLIADGEVAEVGRGLRARDAEACMQAGLQAHTDAGLRTVFVPAVSGDTVPGAEARDGEHALRPRWARSRPANRPTSSCCVPTG